MGLPVMYPSVTLRTSQEVLSLDEAYANGPQSKGCSVAADAGEGFTS